MKGGGGGGELFIKENISTYVWQGLAPAPVKKAASYQSLYGLKTYILSEATNFHIRAF